MRLVPWPSMRAPISISISARSAISGSCAAFSSTVSPSASAAAIRKFSVPVTVTMSVRDAGALQPLQPFGQLGDHVAVLDHDLGAHRLQALDVLVDRARADRAAAGQRDRGLAEARQQRAERQHRGAHGLDQLVGRFGRTQPGRIDADACRRSSRSTRHAHVADQLEHGRHVLQARHVLQHRPAGRSAARRKVRAARRSWRRKSGLRRGAGGPRESTACP